MNQSPISSVESIYWEYGVKAGYSECKYLESINKAINQLEDLPGHNRKTLFLMPRMAFSI